MHGSGEVFAEKSLFDVYARTLFSYSPPPLLSLRFIASRSLLSCDELIQNFNPRQGEERRICEKMRDILKLHHRQGRNMLLRLITRYFFPAAVVLLIKFVKSINCLHFLPFSRKNLFGKRDLFERDSTVTEIKDISCKLYIPLHYLCNKT